MTETNHTPGDWKTVRIGVSNGRIREQIVSGGRGVLCVDYDATQSTEGAANLRLAVSAPELLSACEAALDWANNSTFATNDFAVKLRAAIQKARGGE